MSYKIIVARYNEDIEWLFTEKDNCIIYNKGNPLDINLEIPLNNVGRESDTYLNYIINNYYNLPDIVVFTQANIEDHREKNDVNYLLKLKDEALLYEKSVPTVVYNYINNPSKAWGPHWNSRKSGFYLKNNYKNNTPQVFIDWFKKNINENYPNPIKIYGNALFAVKKELILNRPIEYYQKLILEVNHHINPSEGHFFERSWYYIFNE
jgi:hypothetical protein